MSVFVRLVMVLVLSAAVGGCAFFKPQTTIRGPGGWEFTTSQEQDVVVEKPDIQKTASGDLSVKMDRIAVTNKSVAVLNALVDTMLAFVQQQKAANEGIIGAFHEITAWFEAVKNTVNVPAGVIDAMAKLQGQSGDTTISWGAVEAQLAAMKAQIASTSQPASQ